jgi:hypothetical protein
MGWILAGPVRPRAGQAPVCSRCCCRFHFAVARDPHWAVASILTDPASTWGSQDSPEMAPAAFARRLGGGHCSCPRPSAKRQQSQVCGCLQAIVRCHTARVRAVALTGVPAAAGARVAALHPRQNASTSCWSMCRPPTREREERLTALGRSNGHYSRCQVDGLTDDAPHIEHLAAHGRAVTANRLRSRDRGHPGSCRPMGGLVLRLAVVIAGRDHPSARAAGFAPGQSKQVTTMNESPTRSVSVGGRRCGTSAALRSTR